MLIINEATKEDIGMYYAVTNGGESKAELDVAGKFSQWQCFYRAYLKKRRKKMADVVYDKHTL